MSDSWTFQVYKTETWAAMRMWLTCRTRSTGEKPQCQRESWDEYFNLNMVA